MSRSSCFSELIFAQIQPHGDGFPGRFQSRLAPGKGRIPLSTAMSPGAPRSPNFQRPPRGGQFDGWPRCPPIPLLSRRTADRPKDYPRAETPRRPRHPSCQTLWRANWVKPLKFHSPETSLSSKFRLLPDLCQQAPNHPIRGSKPSVLGQSGRGLRAVQALADAP
jgi:hypothetical protein